MRRRRFNPTTTKPVIAKPVTATARRPNEPEAQRAGSSAASTGRPVPRSTPCSGSSISRRYPQTIATTKISRLLSAAALTRIGTRYRKPIELSGTNQSSQAMTATIKAETAMITKRCDSANAR